MSGFLFDILTILGAIAAAAFWGNRQKRKGRAEEKKEAENDAKNAVSRADQARGAVLDDIAAGKLRDDDGYRRD